MEQRTIERLGRDVSVVDPLHLQPPGSGVRQQSLATGAEIAFGRAV